VASSTVGDDVRVLLLGLMGSGKTTVGRHVAASLGVPYLDNDALLAQREGRTTAEFAEAGGDELHDAESRLVGDLLARTDGFVAGVPASVADRPDDVALVEASDAHVVYLHVPPEVLVARVRSDAAHVDPAARRPWLGDDPVAFVTATYTRRDPVLRAAADVVVDGTLSPAEVAAQIEASAR
jgi:shikimate kinase